MSYSHVADQGIDTKDHALYRRITLRLIPFIFICYLFNYLDRVNVGFAKLQMLDALQFSETTYGLGAGIFFIGYVLCGLPSNLALTRYGPRRWIALMMISWGLLSTCLLFVSTPAQFYSVRLLTGAAEAGFFPGIVLYLSQWFPAYRRGRIMALFMSAIPVSGLLGGPFSGWTLSHFGVGQGALAAWQWMFLIQGVPTAILGCLALVLLSDSVAKAAWLSAAERKRVEADLHNERRWHLVVPMLMGAIGLMIAVNFAGHPAIAILGLTLATMGALTGLPMFWPVPTALLSAGTVAGGLAIINSLGQMAGFLSPYIVGFIKDQTGSTGIALYALAGLIVIGSLVAFKVSAKARAAQP